MTGIEYHMGRSFSGTRLEDGCPCPKAPCGLVLANGLGVDPDCPEHSLAAGKTIRQTHRADACPGLKESSPAPHRKEADQ